jgi:cathepsin L
MIDYFPITNMTSETNYPYVLKKDSCSANAGLPPKYLAGVPSVSDQSLYKGWLNNSEALLMARLIEGPVVVAIVSSCGGFSSYHGGVFSAPGCNANDVDHAVLIVGYGYDSSLSLSYW